MKKRNPITRDMLSPKYRQRIERDRKADAKRGYRKHKGR